ncbi:serine/threonine-protein kinase PknK [Anaerolineales bacterium]|nr:serine/threonine-protein kinase PknK [Anaerolineales bacterium]
MEALKLHWLGHPLIELKGKPVKLETRKAAALLSYLSLNAGECSREVLSAMLWQEGNQQKALANLRRTLSSLNSSLPGWIEADRDKIALKKNGKLWVDVETFHQSLSQVKEHSHPDQKVCEECLSLLEGMAALYQGDFMEGLNLDDSPTFDEWQFFQRDGLRQQFAGVLQHLSAAHSERAQWDQAIASARRWITLDRLHEPACRALMDLYARSGQRSAALRQYEELSRSLREQMGQEPESETRRLYEQIRGKEGATPATAPPERFPLLKTKLYLPTLPSSRVVRSGLIAHLADVDKKALTVISAPAGFGKTTLLAEWIAQTSLPVAWLSLDNGDNDPYRFLSYLVSALESVHEGIGIEARQIMQSMQLVPPHIILASLMNDLGRLAEPYVLVLDDYQFITEHAVHEAMSYLLDHIPSNMHLVIATRADPPLQLGRLRAHGQMLELRTQDLRFKSQEAAEFLNAVMQLGLSAEDIDALEAHTEGWVVGLKMAALSMQGREDASEFIRAFSGSHRYVLDYLVEEVLKRQPPHVQTFLLETSILEKLNGPLCDALMIREWKEAGESGQAVLENLERNNLFLIPLDDHKQWYRYHHLFADLLRSRLQQSAPERIVQLLSHATEWCEQNGQVTEAVGYALAARDYVRAGDLVARYWGVIAQNGEIETVWSWLNALPENIIRNNAPLSITFCWVLWLKGQISAIEAHLVDAERTYIKSDLPREDIRDDESYALLPAEIAALRSFVARYHAEHETAITYAERAIQLLSGNPLSQANAQLRAPIYLALATAHNGAGHLQQAVDACAESIRWSRLGKSATGLAATYLLIKPLLLLGRLRAADEACRDALRFTEEHGMSRLPAAGILHVALSEVLVEQNEMESAEAHLIQGIEQGKWSGRLDGVRNAAPALVRLRLARGDTSGALKAVQEAEVALGEAPPPLSIAELLALRTRVLLQQGSLNEAAHCADKAMCLTEEDRGQAREAANLAMFRVLLARGKPNEAIAQFTPYLITTEERGLLGVAIELHIFRCLAFIRQGDIKGAKTDLLHSLLLAEPEGYVRIFLDEGKPIIKLLKQLKTSTLAPQLKSYVNRLLEAAPPA